MLRCAQQDQHIFARLPALCVATFCTISRATFSIEPFLATIYQKPASKSKNNFFRFRNPLKKTLFLKVLKKSTWFVPLEFSHALTFQVSRRRALTLLTFCTGFDRPDILRLSTRQGIEKFEKKIFEKKTHLFRGSAAVSNLSV